MKFTSKYHTEVTAQDLEEFKNREIIYYQTESESLGSENAILTLLNLQIFTEKVEGFFHMLNGSDKISAYSEERQITLFLKWLLDFLMTYKDKDKSVHYIYSKTHLNDLKEAAILMYYEYINAED